jgi:leucyl-tRNA synthetase
VAEIQQRSDSGKECIEAAADITEARARELALEDPKVLAFLEGKIPRRVIYVPGRLVNIVV